MTRKGKQRREGGRERVISVVGSVTVRSSPPQRGHYRGMEGGHVGGACHLAYWQSVSKAAGRRGNNRSRDRRVPARKEKSTLLRIPGNERGRYVKWVVVRGQQSTGPEEDSRDEGGAEYIVALCCRGGRLGMS